MRVRSTWPEPRGGTASPHSTLWGAYWLISAAQRMQTQERESKRHGLRAAAHRATLQTCSINNHSEWTILWLSSPAAETKQNKNSLNCHFIWQGEKKNHHEGRGSKICLLKCTSYHLEEKKASSSTSLCAIFFISQSVRQTDLIKKVKKDSHYAQ